METLTSYPAPTRLQDVSFVHNDAVRVHLVDIPGFSEAEEQDAAAPVQLINDFVSAGKTFSGIVFLQPICSDDEHKAGLALRNVELLHQLRGDAAEAHPPTTVLATSEWSRVTPEDAERRERELVEATDSFFGRMYRDGAKVFRYDETRESALEILSYVLAQRQQLAALPAAAQVPAPATSSTAAWSHALPLTPAPTPAEEKQQQQQKQPIMETPVVARHVAFAHKASQTDDTPEAVAFRAEIQQARESHMARMAAMYGQMEQAAREHDAHLQGLFGAEIEGLQAQLREGAEVQARLRQELADLAAQRDADVAAVRDEMAQALARRDEEHARETEAKLTAVRTEMAADADGKLRALRAEFERERDQTARSVRAEMQRMAEREQEARERAKHAEMAAHRSGEYRQPLQAWAVARLWGVGQTKSR